MPNIKNIRPIVKITNKQFQALLERAIGREPGSTYPALTLEDLMAHKGRRQAIMEGAIPGTREYGNIPVEYPTPLGLNVPPPISPPPETPTGFPGAPDVATWQGILRRRLGITPELPPPGAVPEILPEVIPPPARRPLGSPGMEALQKHITPQEKIMGRLYTNVGTIDEPIWAGEDLPFEEALARYRASPQAFKPGGWAPSVTRFAKVEPGSPEDVTGELARGIAYQRIKYRPVTLEVPDEVKVALKEERASKRAELKAQPILEGTRRHWESIWKELGGSRSITGRTWKSWMGGSRLRHMYGEGEQMKYFVDRATYWREKPVESQKQFPRETKYLKGLWDSIMEGKDKGSLSERTVIKRPAGD